MHQTLSARAEPRVFVAWESPRIQHKGRAVRLHTRPCAGAAAAKLAYAAVRQDARFSRLQMRLMMTTRTHSSIELSRKSCRVLLASSAEVRSSSARKRTSSGRTSIRSRRKNDRWALVNLSYSVDSVLRILPSISIVATRSSADAVTYVKWIGRMSKEPLISRPGHHAYQLICSRSPNGVSRCIEWAALLAFFDLLVRRLSVMTVWCTASLAPLGVRPRVHDCHDLVDSKEVDITRTSKSARSKHDRDVKKGIRQSVIRFVAVPPALLNTPPPLSCTVSKDGSAPLGSMAEEADSLTFSQNTRVTRPLRGSVSCGSGWSVPCVSIQLTLSQNTGVSIH